MTPTPELLALRDVCARLDGGGIAYMLTGSLPMSFYTRPRMTRDIDLVIALEAEAAQRLIGALGAEYHADAGAITAAIRGARPWNIIHLPSIVKIDLIPRKDTDYRRTEFDRRRQVELAGVRLWIVSAEDLILSKLEWSRESRSEQQRRDVKVLLEAPLDRAYLDEWAARLGLAGFASGMPKMNDTSPEIEALLRARYAAMSGAERAFMALQMFETAQRIVLSSLDPGLSAQQRQRELCRRFYGDGLARAAFPDAA